MLVLVLLTGCVRIPGNAPELTQYNATFLTLFDTVTTMVGRYPSEKEFSDAAQSIHDELLEYHQLFDIYNDYEGIANLKTVNDNAGVRPVTVDPGIIDLLLDCKAYAALTGGLVIFGVLGAMLLLNYALTLMVLCFVPVLVLCTAIFRKLTACFILLNTPVFSGSPKALWLSCMLSHLRL